jgi:hypothetical protein
MFQKLKKLRGSLEHEHGWEVPVECPVCGHGDVPLYEGWTPSRAIRFGNRATMFARLRCAKCHSDLKDAAGRTLIQLFSEQPIPQSNQRILRGYVAFAIVALLICVGGIAWIAFARPGNRLFLAMIMAPVVLLRPLGMALNYAIAAHRRHCDCGAPAWKFMGLLGRTYCYRCSTCGKLLRLRD